MFYSKSSPNDDNKDAESWKYVSSNLVVFNADDTHESFHLVIVEVDIYEELNMLLSKEHNECCV